jgi:hypothetical protein
MKTKLARKLKRYYKRSKNKIYFNNGMTLSRVADTMWEQLGYSNAHPSVLSRVVGGKRLFTFEQLETFCDVLDLEDGQREDLRNALIEDLYAKEGVDLNLAVSSQFLDWAKGYVDMTHQTRIQGNPDLALVWINNGLNELQQKIRRGPAKNMHERLLQFRARLLLEKAAACADSCSSQSVRMRCLRIGTKIVKVARQINDDEIYGLGLLVKGTTWWIDGNCRGAIKLLEKGFEKWSGNGFDLLYQCEFMRILGLSYAELGMAEKFKEIETKMRDLLDAGQLDKDGMTQSLVHSFLGRGYGLLGWPGATQFLEDGQKIYAEAKRKGQRYPLREVQLAISWLEIRPEVERIETDRIRKIGNRGIWLAGHHGNHRHYKQISKRLQEIGVDLDVL